MPYLLPRWHANLKDCHALALWHSKLKNWHVFGTFIGRMARTHVGTDHAGKYGTHDTRFSKPHQCWNMFLVANKVLFKNYFLEKSMFAGLLRALKDFATFSGKP